MLDIAIVALLPFVLMTSRVVTQGLKQSADNDANNSTLAISSMSITNFGTLLATTTTIAAATQKASSALDSHAVDSSASPIMSLVATFGTATGIISVSNITAHRVASGTYTNVHGGVDGLSITKDNTYTAVPTLQFTYATA
jgi:hypothetical protein